MPPQRRAVPQRATQRLLVAPWTSLRAWGSSPRPCSDHRPWNPAPTRPCVSGGGLLRYRLPSSASSRVHRTLTHRKRRPPAATCHRSSKTLSAATPLLAAPPTRGSQKPCGRLGLRQLGNSAALPTLPSRASSLSSASAPCGWCRGPAGHGHRARTTAPQHCRTRPAAPGTLTVSGPADGLMRSALAKQPRQWWRDRRRQASARCARFPTSATTRTRRATAR